MKRPPFEIFPVIENDNLLLREITINDIPEIVEISVYDGKTATNVSEAEKILKLVTNDYYSCDTIHWGIILKNENGAPSGKIIGTCGYYRGFEKNTGEIGYILKEAFQGRGLMTEAARLIINFGFDFLNLDTIYAITDFNNFRSVALLERLKFKEMKIPETEYRQFGLFKYDFQ
jgi:ribosomal-protein-alanine N-acetyltransferase